MPVEHRYNIKGYIDGLVQDCSNSIANALELLQSCTEPFYNRKYNQNKTKTQQTREHYVWDLMYAHKGHTDGLMKWGHTSSALADEFFLYVSIAVIAKHTHSNKK